MRYEMEELVPIVGKLAEKYTAHESTSITYEKVEQLMGAVLYCIHEFEQFESDFAISSKNISAQRAYETGTIYVKKKVKKALELYNETLLKFDHYENYCLYDTFINGLPEFFKWYDIQFEPQNTILTLDYPVLKDISGYTGIDKIYEFIECIRLEQKFLDVFPEVYVINVLSKYNGQYKDMNDNICEIVFVTVIGHILAGKQLSETGFEEKDYLHIQKILMETDFNDINRQLENATKAFVQKHCENSIELVEYLANSIGDIVVRLKNAAESGLLQQIL